MKAICTVFILSLATVVSAQVPLPETAVLELPEIWREAGPQARLAALRVAEIDAKRRLAERIRGHLVCAETLSLDFELAEDTLQSAVDASLRGAAQMAPARYTRAGVVYVVYGVKLREVVSQSKINGVSLRGERVDLTEREEPVARDQLLAVIGNGALPESPGLAMLKAKRAAELDAFRKMAERLSELQLTSTSSSKGSVLSADTIRVSIQQNLKGLEPVDIVYADDGSCRVRLRLTVAEAVKTVERSVCLAPGWFGPKPTAALVSLDQRVKKKTFSVTGFGAPPAVAADENE